MNTPNKLTILRILMVPVVMFFMLTETIPDPLRSILAAVFFVAAALTDLADGRMARKRNLVTNFGKFLDPLADKIIVIAALVCLCYAQYLHPWIVMVVVAREFVVTGVRLAAAGSEDGVVIPAGVWGKLKTVLQMVAITVLILMPIPELRFLEFLGMILIYAAVAMTVISGADYVWKYRKFINYRE